MSLERRSYMLNVSLKEHLEDIDNDLASLILTVSETAIEVKDQLPDLKRKADATSMFQKPEVAIDKWADRHFNNKFMKSGLVRTVSSEERSVLVTLNADGRFHLTSDPIDGSSNIDSNNLIATIIGVYDRKHLPTETPGKYQVAALYILYGPETSLVFTTGDGTHEFLYSMSKREFILKQENAKLPEKGILYGFGGLRRDWEEPFRKYVEKLERDGLKLRYTGAFGGDVTQIRHYGGICGYTRTKKHPNGKLRLLFESNPMAKIIEEAGGASSDGRRSILEIKPKKFEDITKTLWQTSPTYLGNDYLIDGLVETLKDRPV